MDVTLRAPNIHQMIITDDIWLEENGFKTFVVATSEPHSEKRPFRYVSQHLLGLLSMYTLAWLVQMSKIRQIVNVFNQNDTV
jgi:hypothetical protein